MYRILISWILLCLILIGCKRPEKQPELRDPIYRDLVEQFEAAEKEIEALTADLEGAKRELVTADPQNGERKVQRQTVFDVQHNLSQIKQKARLLELQAERRKIFAREAYLKAFQADRPWPSPSEFRVYEVNKRLISTPKTYEVVHRERLEKMRSPASISK